MQLFVTMLKLEEQCLAGVSVDDMVKVSEGYGGMK